VLWNVEVLLIIACTAVTQIYRTKQHGKLLSCKADRTFSMMQYSGHVSEYFYTHYTVIEKMYNLSSVCKMCQSVSHSIPATCFLSLKLWYCACSK
jgi:hypothetical protein